MKPPPIPNPQREWDDDGLFISNPDGINSSMGTSISNSGVVNYLNKFGQLTSNEHKSFDPVSELFYAATRYVRNKGNISSYTTTTPSYDTADPVKWADGFPVITQWNDPIQYSCQKNIILGIGDVNTHRDKNLPGNTNSSEEPSVPTEVSSDSDTPVVTATQKIASLEGITINTPFTGRNNSAYIAGLAYLANTQDLRSDLAGKQTISTYWMDVRESGVLANRANNQYWLAAKYGGFKVPKTFGDPLTRTASLDLGWWSDGDYLDNGDQRPRNFYVASDAVRMTQSLEEAFAKLVDEVRTTTTTLTANSTSLDTGTLIFQSLFDSSDWSGDLLAKSTSTDATVSDTELWSAAAQLDALSEANLDNRKIFTSLPATTDGTTGAQRSTTGINFTWNALASSQQLALRATKDSAQLVDTSLAQNRLSYLRGSRALEYSASNNSNPFRARSSRLGDIVNSDPQYIHQQDFGYTRLPSMAQGFTSNVATDYQTFRASASYKSRKPLILVGANDGMLHGFDASATGGQELFAYVPNNVIGNLYELTLPSYAHRYYVDGTPRISDAYINNSWKTLVVGSTGAGGNSIFALDITNPSNMSSSALLWEFSHAELGYTLGRPSLTALPNGKFGVVVSSGYGRTTSTTDGYLWILDAADGSILKQFTLPNSGDLGAPLVLDLDNNRISDRIYVADTHGNVWRVDTLGTDPSNWDAPDNAAHSQLKDATGNIIPLFIATDRTYTRQPITAPLDAAYLDENRLILAFGTGSFYRDTDADIPQPPNSPQIESFYGIIDDGTPVYSSGSPLAGRDQLTLQHILKEVSNNVFKGRAVTENPASNSSRGWLLDLVWDEVYGGTGPQGERVVTKAILGSNRVVFTSLIPSEDPCAAGGTSWLMSLSLLTGRRLSYSYFDYNGDGRLDNSDYITLDDNTQVPVSGISDPDEGIIKSPLTLTDNTNAKRYLCLASSAASSTAAGVRPGCIAIPNNSVTRLSWQQLRDAQ